jgi:hypothetical protein
MYVLEREQHILRLPRPRAEVFALPRVVGPAREMWGVSHADLRGNARTTALLGWLAGLVGDPLA